MAKGKYAIRAESRASQQLADLIATLRQSLLERENEVKELRESLHKAQMAIKHSELSEEIGKTLLETKERLYKSETEKEKYISYLKEIIAVITAQGTHIPLPLSFHLAAKEFGIQHEIMLDTRTKRRNGLTVAKLKTNLEGRQ